MYIIILSYSRIYQYNDFNEQPLFQTALRHRRLQKLAEETM